MAIYSVAKCAIIAVLQLAGSVAAATIGQPTNITSANRASSDGVVPIDDNFTPHEPPINWYAVGDSYTAGPGTGHDYDLDKRCARGNGSYAVQMEVDFPFKETNEMDFIACSGSIAPDTLIQVEGLIPQDKADFMTMTLGGNDIGFSNIALNCLLKVSPSGCDAILKTARQKLQDQSFEDSIHEVYDAVFEKMKDDRHYQLYHVFYHRFFNDETTWCDDKSFGLIGILVPRLSQALRKKMNLLADELNARLGEVANSYIQQQTTASWSQGSRLIALNPDNLTDANGDTYGLFDGHRFCEPGVTNLRDPSVWFFGTITRDSPDLDEGDRRLLLPEILTETFHPKTAGFAAEKRMLQESLQQNRPAEN